jgi:hypothetical protein
MISKLLKWLESDAGEIFAGLFAAAVLLIMSFN